MDILQPELRSELDLKRGGWARRGYDKNNKKQWEASLGRGQISTS